jgi:pilus assembly protein FimV
MSLRYVVRALILAGLLPAGAMALGLGDIHLKSALNAPLDAEIDLTATAEELRSLKVALANRENFSRYGLDYPVYFDSVTLLPGKSADGHDVLQVHSTAPATEPFATLLIEATWARGRLVREYTVLLDPPVFTGDKASSAAAVSAPEVAAQARSGSVERPAAAESGPPEASPAPSTPTSAPSRAASTAPAAASGSYLVHRGDTLSTIAAQHYPNGERERALVALYKANPSAFEGNMNVLHAGATLQVPDESSLAAIAPGEANSEVSSQYRAWAGTHADGGRLHLVPPSEPGSATPAKAAAGESAALQARVTTLQNQLAESQRLLEVKNAELARLQQQINPGAAARAPAPSATTKPGKPAEVAPNPAPAEAPPPPVAEAPKPAPAAAPPVAKRAPAAAPLQPRGGLIDRLTSNWYVPLGVLLVVLAAVFGFRRFKARKEQDFGSTLGRLAHPTFEMPSSRAAETQPMRTLQNKQDSSFVVEESGTHPVPRMGGGDAAPLRPVAVDDALSASGTAVALDQGDPLAEADFHMAYGLYDQAADLVRIAISREPKRRDLRLKLLEVFFVWGNKDQFLTLARELSASRDQAVAGEWEKIVIMGRQIAPEDPLFASSGGLHGVGSGGVDLNLEGGQNRVDFDLLGEPSVANELASDAVDLDLGAALGGNEATGEARAVGDTGVDFILDDPARGGDATGSTREMQQSPTVTLEFGDPSQDSPTVENMMTPDVESPTIRQKLDASTRNLMMSPEATAELAVVDLGLHVSGSDTGLHPLADVDSSSTAMTSLDEETRELFSKAESSHDTQLMPSSPGGTASGTWLFTDKDIGVDLPPLSTDDAPTALATAIMPGSSAGQGLTEQLEALKGQGGGDVDLDLGGLDLTGEPGGTLDLDVGHSAAPSEGSFTATQRLSGQPLMNESEPATMSEVGTKLDLARAYMDMGDPEGARSILEEVLAEGSASQKTEARRLVDSLPG